MCGRVAVGSPPRGDVVMVTIRINEATSSNIHRTAEASIYCARVYRSRVAYMHMCHFFLRQSGGLT